MAIVMPTTVATDEKISSVKQNVLINAVIDYGSLTIGGQLLSDYSNGDTIVISVNDLPTANYDSDWFSVTTNATYTKAHSLGAVPRMVLVYWCSATTTWYSLYTTAAYEPRHYWDNTNVYIVTSASGTYYGLGGSPSSTSGYYRIFAWS